MSLRTSILFLFLVPSVLSASAMDFYHWDMKKSEVKTYTWIEEENDLVSSVKDFKRGHQGHLGWNQLWSPPQEFRPLQQQKRKSLFGRDERRAGIPFDYPERAVGMLDGNCSATLIGPFHILTAAHCLYDYHSQKINQSISFSAAKYANFEPFGTQYADQVFIPSAYIEKGDPEADYALIILDQPVGEMTGWLGISVFQNGKEARLIGYPSDKKFGTPWFSDCRAYLQSRLISHHCDTYFGMSGSAFISSFKNDQHLPAITGIHTSGTFLKNEGRAIDESLFKLLGLWMSWEDSQLKFKKLSDQKIKKEKGHTLYVKNLCHQDQYISFEYFEREKEQKVHQKLYLRAGERVRVGQLMQPTFHYFFNELDYEKIEFNSELKEFEQHMSCPRKDFFEVIGA